MVDVHAVVRDSAQVIEGWDLVLACKTGPDGEEATSGAISRPYRVTIDGLPGRKVAVAPLATE